MLEWNGATKIGGLQMKRHAETILKKIFAKEVPKGAE